MRRLWWGQITTAAATAAVVVLFSLGRPLRLWELIPMALGAVGWSLEARAQSDRVREYERVCDELFRLLDNVTGIEG